MISSAKVYEVLKNIPSGQTISYKNLAEICGNPKAYRAVARICASNKNPIEVPCHRVISSSGSLSGYAFGGVRVKYWLLKFEKEAIF
jgi:O-6-methylguanine DNA methyltransferase